jgi:MinD-like ATPase involved in chromosome partitioning or flagellar assembly
MGAPVISCYSYKGGTGRTTGAANLSYNLALQGKHVCLLDLDIEAPGLVSVVGLREGDFSFFVQKALAASVETPKMMQQLIKEGVPDLRELVTFDPRPEGTLRFIPASSLPGDRTTVKWRGWQPVRLLKSLIANVETEYGIDVFVLDIASGLRNSSIVPMAVSDLILVFFRWSRQHLKGTIDSVRWLEEFRASPDVPLSAEYILIPSAIPPIDEGTSIGRILGDVHRAAKIQLTQEAGTPVEAVERLAIEEVPILKWAEQILQGQDRVNGPYAQLTSAVMDWINRKERRDDS